MKRPVFAPRAAALLPLLATLALAAAAATTFPAVASAETAPIRRFAIVIGANDGGPGRVTLRFANSDAEAFSRVLTQLGGVSQRDNILLTQPSRVQLLDGIIRLQNAIEVAKPQAGRIEALVYYSGHSDENGILLANERITYPELREAINRIPADVRIAILDSCSSGALIRAKGGKHLPPFLIDDSSAVRGHAFLTATSADEAAQESDRIGGSFFTTALVTGLRGAADASHDGRVTLNEAYAFAFNETLARTEKSRTGPQHPAYDIQLVGTGDLVMTDLRATSAGLVLADELEGRIYLRDAGGKLVAELRKNSGAPIELGLEPGTYGVTVESNGVFSKADVTLLDGKRIELRRSYLQVTPGERYAVRGNAPAEGPADDVPGSGGLGEVALPPPPPPPTATMRVVPFNLTLLPGISLAGSDGNVIQRFGLNIVEGRVARLDGVEVALGLNTETESASGAQIAVAGNMVDGEVRGAQIAAGFNYAHEAAGALQVSSGFNWVSGSVSGGQVSSGFNIAHGSLSGLQSGAGFNIVGGPMRGLQVSSGFNWLHGGGRGLQASAGFNISGAELTGMQAAAGFNFGTTVRGLQAAAGVNVAGDVGAQIGTVNIANHATGPQIGVVNIAQDSDYPIGLINIVTNGYLRLTAYTNDMGVPNVGVKMGGKYLYTLLSAGAVPTGTHLEKTLTGGTKTAWVSTVGVGVHVPAGSLLFFDIDATSTNFYRAIEADREILASLRLVAGLQVWRFGVYAGPTLNALVDWTPSDGMIDLGSSRAFGTYGAKNSTQARLFPGFVFGLQI